MVELEGEGTADSAEDVHASVDRFLKKNFKIEDGEDIPAGMSRFLVSFLTDATHGAPALAGAGRAAGITTITVNGGQNTFCLGTADPCTQDSKSPLD